MWILYAFGSTLFAGITSILAKCGMKDVDSNVATVLRTIVVLIFSWILVFVKGVPVTWSTIDGKTLLFLILSGLATGASWLCYFHALQIGDVNKITPIDKSSTVLTMLLAMIFLQESVTVLKVVCMILIGVGTYLMIQKKEAPKGEEVSERNENAQKTELLSDSRKPFAGSWLFFACGSAVFASLTSILGKVGIQNIDSTLGTAIRTIVVLIMAWIVVFVTKTQGTISTLNRSNWLFLGLSGLATGGSWLCYYRALQTGPASVVVPIDKLSILITIAFSYLVFREKLNLKSGIGLGAIVAGTLLLLLA